MRAIVVALALAACSPLDRVEGLEPGSISGRGPAFMHVNVDGVARPRHADDDGAFSIGGLTRGSWVLRLVDDDTGEGPGDRGLVRAVSIGVDAQERPEAVLLGDLELKATGTVSGRVVDGAGNGVRAATVVVFRTGFDLGALGLGALQAEGSTACDDDGAFVLRHLARGPLRVLAFSAGLTSDVTSLAGFDDDVRLVLAPAGAATVVIDFAIDDDANGQGDVDVWIMPAGEAPIGNPTRVALGGDARLAIDPGIVDVFAIRVGVAGQGVLLGQVAVADELTRWGPLLLQERDPCAQGGDVDDDGVGGLPIVDFDQLADPDADPTQRAVEQARRALWATCAETCLSAPRAICTIEDQRFDCDDDDDGQPDVSEEPSCLGACGSTDLDLDGFCDRSDLDPPCSGDDDVCLAPLFPPFAAYLE
ncbi:MAG: carboxypeptidase-like regulatory domain-containing protein [Deltaproteobacteria bacterium]|nr:carboxypeptidase-like regulatory domain-containing protein [Deltaproteobacteria bacterium]